MSAWNETCDQCGFDSARYDVRDALGTLRAIGPMWDETTEGIDEDVLRARPAAEVWSAAEYAAHSADVTEAMGRLLHALLAVDDLHLDGELAAPEPDASAGPAAAVERLQANVARLHRLAATVGPDDDPRWARAGTVGGKRVDAGGALRHAVHDATHHLSDIGRGFHRLGAGAPTQAGTVAQLSVSNGGVPKLPVTSAEVGFGGLVDDRHADRKHHGRPLQALCLWSSEVIDALRAEGHPIHAGAAGENVTIAGADWSTMRPGVQLRIGDVLAELSAYATPCQKNARWFFDGDIERMLHDRHPGWSRIYAWVRRPGRITTGDPVIVEP